MGCLGLIIYLCNNAQRVETQKRKEQDKQTKEILKENHSSNIMNIPADSYNNIQESIIFRENIRSFEEICKKNRMTQAAFLGFIAKPYKEGGLDL